MLLLRSHLIHTASVINVKVYYYSLWDWCFTTNYFIRSLKNVTEIVYKITAKYKYQKLKDIPLLRALVGAKTITILTL